MICVWRAHIEGQAAGAKELLAVSPGSCSPLPRKHGGHCVQHALWLARAVGQKDCSAAEHRVPDPPPVGTNRARRMTCKKPSAFLVTSGHSGQRADDLWRCGNDGSIIHWHRHACASHPLALGPSAYSPARAPLFAGIGRATWSSRAVVNDAAMERRRRDRFAIAIAPTRSCPRSA